MIILGDGEEAVWICATHGRITRGVVEQTVGEETRHSHTVDGPWCSGALTRTTVLPRPPLARDALLAEIARSLRATHPERAEEMIAATERAMPVPPATGLVLHPAQANAILRLTGLPAGTRISEPIAIFTGQGSGVVTLDESATFKPNG